MNTAAQTGWTLAGLVTGLCLSFLSVGLLWIGLPWPYQFLMTLPFLLLAFIIRRFGTTSYTMLIGMLPVGAIFVQFRDNNDSHVMPMALVCSWALAIWLGNYLAARITTNKRNQ